MASAKTALRLRQENNHVGRELQRLQNQLRNKEADYRAEADRQVAAAQRELEGMRSTLRRVMRERDAYRDKLRGAIATMEDAREMMEPPSPQPKRITVFRPMVSNVVTATPRIFIDE